MFEQVSQFGATDEGGVNRPALSMPHLEARAWLRERAIAEGMVVEVDGAANHSVSLEMPGAESTLLIGSHLDSAASGGRFDGALGVIAGFEVLLTLRDESVRLDSHLELIDFTDEESQLIECLGSRALTGDLSEEDFKDPRCGRDHLQKAFVRVGITEESVLHAKRDPSRIAGYLELHIEQGPVLKNQAVQIGVVTGIVGIRTFRLRFFGQQAHAGTTPMADRLDAARGASSFLILANDLVEESYSGCVMTIGRMEFAPGVTSIVPGRVDLFLEFRALQEEKLDCLENDLLRLAKDRAEHYGLSLEIQVLSVVESVRMYPRICEAFRVSAQELDLSHTDIVSGAGHDAQLLSQVTPAGMIFIPSTGGSHNPQEHAEWVDCVNGANVLLATSVKVGV